MCYYWVSVVHITGMLQSVHFCTFLFCKHFSPMNYIIIPTEYIIIILSSLLCALPQSLGNLFGISWDLIDLLRTRFNTFLLIFSRDEIYLEDTVLRSFYPYVGWRVYTINSIYNTAWEGIDHYQAERVTCFNTNYWFKTFPPSCVILGWGVTNFLFDKIFS